MLHYEWGNPSTMMLSEDEREPKPAPALISDPSYNVIQLQHFSATAQPAFTDPSEQPNATAFSDFNSFYDPHSYASACHYAPPPLLPLDSVTEFLVVPKSEEVIPRRPPVDFCSRIGLNLGGRTYFSSSEDDFVNRLYRRSRTGDFGSTNSPRCQAEGCNADLSHAKHYHRRHKVCEFHSKASTVITAGLTQRFCQQCSRFHLLAEFDNGKRSCRKRLADHNRRRRKSQHSGHGSPKSSQLSETTSLIDATAGSLPPVQSGRQSSWSSVTVAMSPPPVSSECFHQRSYHAMASSNSSNSLFYSTG